MTGPIPLSGFTHKGVPLFGEQSAASMARARKHIDRVAAMRDVDELVATCKDRTVAAEARRLAFALLSARWMQAADMGRIRPDINLMEIESFVAHIGLSWHRLIEGWPPNEPEDDLRAG